MGEKLQRKDNNSMLAVLLLLGSVALLFAYLNSSTSPNANPQAKGSARSASFERSVNKHLMYTNDRVELQKQKVEIENKNLLLEKSHSADATQPPHVNENRLDFSSENSESKVAEALGRSERQAEVGTPQDVIQREVFNQEQLAEYTQAYKEAYAQQFIENARKGGYKVILSEDLSRVVSVQPIKMPPKNSYQIFNSDTIPAQ